MMDSSTRPHALRNGPRQTLGSLALLLGTAGTVGAALLFEHVGGYLPCALCLLERKPYYAGVPLAMMALLSIRLKAPSLLTRALLVLVAGAMLYSLVLGVYHAGVEWKAWAGPADCATVSGTDLSGDLLSQIDRVKPPSCDRAAGRFLGLSFAGWNAVASAILALVALVAAFGRPGAAPPVGGARR